MNIKLDENLPQDAVAILRDAGFMVSTVIEQGLGGKTDAEIVAVCKSEKKVLITLDIDFANIGAYPPQDYSGIIVLPLTNLAKPLVLSTLVRLLDSLKRDSLAGKLWIVSEDRIRIRPGDG